MLTPIALVAAVCFGSADFLGGVAARRAGPLPATTAINLFALAIIAAPALLFGGGLSTGNLAAALCGGALSSLTLTLIFAAFTAGAMSLAAPLIACGSVSVPTLAAIATGDPPTPLQGIGIAVALVAVLAITWPRRPANNRAVLGRRALTLAGLAALSSGATLAVLQLATGGGTGTALGVSGLSRASAAAACLVALAIARPRSKRTTGALLPTLAAGTLEAVGATLFLLATTLGNRAVVAVLVSLYAIATIVLAQIVLAERFSRVQSVAVATVILGIVLMSAG